MKRVDSPYPAPGIPKKAKPSTYFCSFISSGFQRLSIAHKLILGFMSVVLLVFAISFFALLSLNRLNALSTSILKTDVVVIDSIEKMVDAVLAQELYAQRYLILKNPNVLELFWEKDKEFLKLARRIEVLPDHQADSIAAVVTLHRSYRDTLVRGFTFQTDRTSMEVESIEAAIRKKQEALMVAIKKMKTDVTHDQREKTAETSAIGKKAFQISILLCALGLVVSIVTALLITRNISGAINQLMLATQRIAKGDFDFQPDIRNADELGALSTAFVQMAQRLKQLEEMNLDASPLTRLPGGVSIEKNLQLRIESHRKIAFCLVDINHFKAFNDSYGYVKGNDLIRATAEIIKDVVSASGTADDFIGHIGGDDFVVMTDPDNFKKICTEIIERFDRTAPGFYDEETRQRQYLISHNRQGQQVTFPLASLSIAVVTNVNRQLASHIEYGEVAAELKEYAKSKSGSNWVVDRRRHSSQANHPLHQT